MTVLSHYRRATVAATVAIVEGCRGYFVLSNLSPNHAVCSAGVINGGKPLPVLTAWGTVSHQMSFLTERFGAMGLDSESINPLIQSTLHELTGGNWVHGFIAHPGSQPNSRVREFTGGSIVIEPSLN
jgi:hypothetical protein